ncbi:hypothetical protein RIF29_10059 [Crotalaria pallida]|uniref:Uncharacterized protein n=1 Tax=Crotalaria pallida TaxID=3830 RepID=A0AAN9IJW7_CROPI
MPRSRKRENSKTFPFPLSSLRLSSSFSLSLSHSQDVLLYCGYTPYGKVSEPVTVRVVEGSDAIKGKEVCDEVCATGDELNFVGEKGLVTEHDEECYSDSDNDSVKDVWQKQATNAPNAVEGPTEAVATTTTTMGEEAEGGPSRNWKKRPQQPDSEQCGQDASAGNGGPESNVVGPEAGAAAIPDAGATAVPQTGGATADGPEAVVAVGGPEPAQSSKKRATDKASGSAKVIVNNESEIFLVYSF